MERKYVSYQVRFETIEIDRNEFEKLLLLEKERCRHRASFPPPQRSRLSAAAVLAAVTVITAVAVAVTAATDAVSIVAVVTTVTAVAVVTAVVIAVVTAAVTAAAHTVADLLALTALVGGSLCSLSDMPLRRSCARSRRRRSRSCAAQWRKTGCWPRRPARCSSL